MSDEDLISHLIGRLLAKRPDLWLIFQSDPLGALEEAGIQPTEAERAAIERAGRRPGFHTTKTAKADTLAEELKADLAAARASRAIDFNPFTTPEKATTEASDVDESLLEEQRRLRDRAEAMRASLAEEKRRLAEERERALRKLGGGRKETGD